MYSSVIKALTTLYNLLDFIRVEYEKLVIICFLTLHQFIFQYGVMALIVSDNVKSFLLVKTNYSKCNCN